MRENKNIVLIDDDYATNVYHEIIFKDVNLPISITIFDSAEKALEELQELSTLPEFIFLDINMPRMDGWEFLDAFSTLVQDKNPPTIIMLTTSLSSFDNEKSKSHQLVNRILEKPLSVEKIERLISNEP